MRIHDLGHSYNEKYLFQNLNLHIKPTDFLLIRGPSGCGKSTLLKIIAQFLPVQKGRIDFENPGLRIGYLHQDCHLIEHWSVQENLGLVSSDTKITQDLLARFNLENSFKRLVRDLSGGEKQRVSLTRTLLQNPDLALLDEPTSHLDDRNAAEIVQFIKEFFKEKMVIIVSHDHRIDSLAKQTLDWKNLISYGV